MEQQPIQPQPQSDESPQTVYMSRAVEPKSPQIPLDVQTRHDQSMRDFPQLNLSKEEYIVGSIKRHSIGLMIPLAIMVFMTTLVALLIFNYSIVMRSLNIIDPPSGELVVAGGLVLMLLFALGGYIAVWVYQKNTFFLTNESVIQEIQNGLFSRIEQTVSLGNIEDASFDQEGILPTLLDYGSIRLSTEGDETTYRFQYVTHPKQQIALLSNAVEAFKNGRPVSGD